MGLIGAGGGILAVPLLVFGLQLTVAQAAPIGLLAVGFFSGLLGVGGGFVMVPALQRYTDLTARSVVATSLAVIALVSLAGVGSSSATGQLNVEVGVPFAAGGAVGMGAAVMLSSHLIKAI